MVRILTDTSSLYTPAQGEEMGFSVVPLNVTIAGETYQEMVEIDTPEFVDIINQGNIPTSSQPSPGPIIELYETATEESPILHITIVDGLSGAYLSACGIRETMENKEFITVYDCGSLCGPQWHMVNIARECAEKGMSMEEIIAVLDKYKATAKSFLIPQDFGYLRRGGRLTPTAATVGSLLKLVPLMTTTANGKKIEKAGICRNFTKAIEKTVELLKKLQIDKNYLITISHAQNIEEAKLAESIIKKEFPDCEYKVVLLTPAFTTQGGPKCIAIQTVMK